MSNTKCPQCGMLKLEKSSLKEELRIFKEREDRFLHALLKICAVGGEGATIAKQALGFDPTMEQTQRAG